MKIYLEMILNVVYRNVVHIISEKHPEVLSRLKWSSLWQYLTALKRHVRYSSVFGCIVGCISVIMCEFLVRLTFILIIYVHMLNALNYVVVYFGILNHSESFLD